MVTFVPTPVMTASSEAVGRVLLAQLAAWFYDTPSPPPSHKTVAPKPGNREPRGINAQRKNRFIVLPSV
jgi:hypothetical protein